MHHQQAVVFQNQCGGKDQAVSFGACYYGHWICLVEYRWRGLQQSFRLSRVVNRAQQRPVTSKNPAAGKSRITVTLTGKFPGLPVLAVLD